MCGRGQIGTMTQRGFDSRRRQFECQIAQSDKHLILDVEVLGSKSPTDQPDPI